MPIAAIKGIVRLSSILLLVSSAIVGSKAVNKEGIISSIKYFSGLQAINIEMMQILAVRKNVDEPSSVLPLINFIFPYFLPIRAAEGSEIASTNKAQFIL